MPLLETPGHSWASLGLSLVRSLLLLLGPWCAQGSVCVLQESVSPVLCVFCWFYGVVNGDLLQEGLCYAQIYCTQSPCPCSRSLLTHISLGDTEKEFCLSICGVSGFWCVQGMSAASEHIWQVWGLILNAILLLLPVCHGFSSALEQGVSPKSRPAARQPLLQCLRFFFFFSLSLFIYLFLFVVNSVIHWNEKAQW